MDSSELIILDVGHGNCAMIRAGNRAVVVDAPAKPVVSEALDTLGIAQIDALILSHADVDHTSGAIGILANPARPVNALWVNPDSSKATTSWRDLRIAVRDARGRTNCHSSLTSTAPGSVNFFDATFDILYPTPEVALGGAGSTDLDGRHLTSNSMSAVILVKHQDEPVCLLAGDMDETALRNLVSDGRDLGAPILVFPHHGGRPGAYDAYAFAEEVTRRVHPDVVVISMGRSTHNNPRPEVIEGIRVGSGGKAHIACTQLSHRCAAQLPGDEGKHLMNIVADGRPKGMCCAGSIVFKLAGGATTPSLPGLLAPHRGFVGTRVPGGLCKVPKA